MAIASLGGEITLASMCAGWDRRRAAAGVPENTGTTRAAQSRGALTARRARHHCFGLRRRASAVGELRNYLPGLPLSSP
jgi:hypothetical protein